MHNTLHTQTCIRVHTQSVPRHTLRFNRVKRLNSDFFSRVRFFKTLPVTNYAFFFCEKKMYISLFTYEIFSFFEMAISICLSNIIAKESILTLFIFLKIFSRLYTFLLSDQ